MQAMGAEAGFDIKLEVLQAAATVAKVESGDFDATTGIWSGRPDPDGNIASWFACDGFLNRGKWCDPETDKALALGRSLTDPAARRPHYRLAVGRILADRPHIILYHYRWFWAMGAGVTGFQPTPDGIVRWAGMRRP
jgi:peptide/nickel transport system substrate-binding protein